ncbi:hypothetical protein VNO78_11234 [Psophocarpus tetragonolobus]|uniref:Uncharacterized protein n=1 Tax=Psophocarpus tetragonolobus TaxID=3891 RepID=A0AAN9SNK4_PSOTE
MHACYMMIVLILPFHSIVPFMMIQIARTRIKGNARENRTRWGGNGPHVDKGTEINKYPQLLLVLSEANSQKLHQFFHRPQAFVV